MGTRSSNAQRDQARADLIEACWPQVRLAEALSALARRQGLPAIADAAAPTFESGTEQLSAWLVAAAEHIGLQANQVLMTSADIPSIISQAPPLLLRVETAVGPRFLVVLSGGRRTIGVLGPNLRVRRLRARVLCEALRAPSEGPIAADVERLVAVIGVHPHHCERARQTMLTDRLAMNRIPGCWTLRPRLDGSLQTALRDTGVLRAIATLLIAHLVQSVMFVSSWWLLGFALLDGTPDRGWLLGWLLLLMSLVPVRLLASWTQGLVAIDLGSGLRRRLLRGAFGIERQRIRHQGAGQFFGLVGEAALLESVALNAAVATVLAGIELLLAALVLWLGMSVLLVALLFVWIGIAAWSTWRYFTHHSAWTSERLGLSCLLLESLIGHRTRLAQQPRDKWHGREDIQLERYSSCGRSMDRTDLWLLGVLPRAWLVTAAAALIPTALAGASPSRLAVITGGILLAYRAHRRLAAGLTGLAGSVVAGQVIAPVVRAASSPDESRSLSAALIPARSQAADASAVHARDIAFRYRSDAEPILRGCSLDIPSGARMLLEGASGSGKTTFASILAGLTSPGSGLVLAGGLDRQTLGAASWRSRVIMAPQPHDNYIFSESLAFNALMGRGWPARPSDLVEAEEVCRELGLGELLDRMPGGLHEMVGETGWRLSQGERTRVFVARALLQAPGLLVLDESFGALDPENVERAVRCVERRASAVLAVVHT
jgi:ATP-binding cassette subfamily B protein